MYCVAVPCVCVCVCTVSRLISDITDFAMTQLTGASVCSHCSPQLLLDYLPLETPKWDTALHRKRTLYQEFIQELILDTHNLAHAGGAAEVDPLGLSVAKPCPHPRLSLCVALSHPRPYHVRYSAGTDAQPDCMRMPCRSPGERSTRSAGGRHRDRWDQRRSTRPNRMVRCLPPQHQTLTSLPRSIRGRIHLNAHLRGLVLGEQGHILQR